MSMKLRNGDYVPNGAGGFQMARGTEELLEDALFLLMARRGGFAPMPQLGSRLHLLGREKPSARQALAVTYVREALAPLGLTVRSVTILERDILELQVELELRGQTVKLEVEIR